MESANFGSPVIEEPDSTRCPLLPDYTIFWDRGQLYAWYLSVKNRVIEPPKIRRQTPKPPRHERV